MGVGTGTSGGVGRDHGHMVVHQISCYIVFGDNGTAKLVDLGAQLLRKTQSGYLYHYAFAMIVGLILLLGAVIKFWQ